MSEKQGFNLSISGRLSSSAVSRSLLVVWLVAFAAFAGAATAEARSGPGDDDPAGGAWSLAQAYFFAGAATSDVAEDGPAAAGDPAGGAWSLAQARFLAGIAASDGAEDGPAAADDPAGGAWSLAQAAFNFVSYGQDAMPGKVDGLTSSFCSVC